MDLEILDMKEAQRLIKQWAREKDSERFNETEHLNLIAKNFWFPEHYRKDFRKSKKNSNPASCIFLSKKFTKYKLHSHPNYVEMEDGTFFRVQELKLTKSLSRN